MDLRAFVAEIDSRGLLEKVTREVHWKHEIGRITRETRRPILFERIIDYPNYQLFANGLSTYRTIGIAFGLGEVAGRDELVAALRRRMGSIVEPTMSDAPLDHEVVLQGDEVDLTSLPVPWWSPIDAGRYIGTWHLNVTSSPESGKRNVGVYRMQILDRNHATVSVSPQSHLHLHFNEAERMNRPLPMAVPIGVPEAIVAAAGGAPPFGLDEYRLASTFAQESVRLARCAESDLAVPATAEIVMEGVIVPHERVTDGPYLDYAGIPSVNTRALLFEVKRLSRRRSALFRGTSVGVPGAEDHVLFSVLTHLGLVDFHGKRIKHSVQQFLLRHRMFRGFQLSGSIGYSLRKGGVE